MVLSNVENSTWNEAHGGNRIPINNSEVEGAPFALSSNDPSWKNGSVNNAVYKTYILENYLDEESFDFSRLIPLINKNMLYGFNGESRGKNIHDLLSFRGYPTPEIYDTVALFSAVSSSLIDVEGNSGVQSKCIVFTHCLTLNYKVPFEIVFNLNLTINNNLIPVLYDFKIDPGNLKTTHYRVTAEEVNEWVPLVGNKAYFSFASEDVYGDVNIEIFSTNIVQEPVYYSNDLAQKTLIIPEIQYSPNMIYGNYIGPTAFKGESVDGTFDLSTVSNYLSRVEQCNDFLTEELFPKTIYQNQFFLKTGDFLGVGTKLYRDINAVLPALSNPSDAGAFFWVENAPYFDTTYKTIFQISKFLILNSDSIITYYDENRIGYMGTSCWVTTFT